MGGVYKWDDKTGACLPPTHIIFINVACHFIEHFSVMISGFLHEVDDICVLLGCYAA